jgi:photosystem II stability/assembly factor-like uncharacterized protein
VQAVDIKGVTKGAAMTAGEVVTSIFFIDASTGWAVTDAPADPKDPSKRRGIVLGTTDGGTSWRDLSSGTSNSIPYALNDVWFVTAREGWAVGGNVEGREEDVILHTTDGGRSWKRQESRSPQMIRAIQFVDADRGWAVGLTIDLDSKELGISRILASTDGGDSWTQQFPSPRSLFDVCFADPLHGWAVGDRATIYATADGGKSWSLQSRFVTSNATNIIAPGRTLSDAGLPRSYTSVFFVDPSLGFAGGDGVLLKRK